MAALSGEKTLAELAAEFGVHPTMISNWKQELVKRATELFARGSKAPAAADAQKVIDDLHRKIGQLQVECDFLAGQPAISRLLSSWTLLTQKGERSALFPYPPDPPIRPLIAIPQLPD
jgi:transposase